jgi:hypothetical protein
VDERGANDPTLENLTKPPEETMKGIVTPISKMKSVLIRLMH